MPSPNYVKFQRGTVAAYNRLKNNSALDDNTLYFIYESLSSTTGSLYMGDLLIAGGVSAELPSSLESLASVLENAEGVAFLMADSNGEWKIATPSQVLEALDISGGEDTLEVDSNQFIKVSGVLKLKGFDEADNNSVLQKINGKVTWGPPQDYSSDIANLQSTVGTLSTTIAGLDTVIANKIAQANHLSYSVVDELPENSEAANNVIYLVPNSSSSESDAYNEYLLVNGSFEKVGVRSGGTADLSDYFTKSEVGSLLNAKADLTSLNAIDGRVSALESASGDYVLTTTFNSVVGELSAFNSYEAGVTNSIIDELNVLDNRLTWQELTE